MLEKHPNNIAILFFVNIENEIVKIIFLFTNLCSEFG